MIVTDTKKDDGCKQKTTSDRLSLLSLGFNFAQRVGLDDKGGSGVLRDVEDLVSTSQYHASLNRSQQKVRFE